MDAPVFANDVTAALFSRYGVRKKSSATEKRVLVIYTGGTIGMIRTPQGYVPAKNIYEEALKANRRFFDPAEFQLRQEKGQLSEGWFITCESIYGRRTLYRLTEMDPLLDSSNMTMENWVKIAEEIEKNYESYDAFVVLHGTDTMAYTCSILSFMLEHLAKSVIVTGSQIPFCEIRNDAVENFLGSLTIAGHFEIPEVCLYFDNKLYRGNRIIKSNNFTLNPFESPNLPYLVKSGISYEIKWNLIRRPHLGHSFKVHKALSDQISILTIFPCIAREVVEAALQPPTQGVVLLSYGCGNIPDNRPELLSAFQAATSRGVVIVNISQCKKGRISDSYHCGRILGQLGVVSGKDMSLECAVAKLSYLLGKHPNNPSAVRRLIAQDLRGELTQSDKESLSFDLSAFSENIASSLGIHDTTEKVAINSQLFPVLMNMGARQGSLSLLETLLQEGVSINCCDYDLRTPLHVAASHGQIECVRFLIGNGANMNETDRRGHTPLFEALEQGHYLVTDELTTHNAKLKTSEEVLAPALC